MYTPSVKVGISAAFMCAALGAAATAQPCRNHFDCDAPGPNGGWSLGRDGEGRPDFVPDRRPVFWFNLYCGDECRACGPVPNPKGQSPYWAEADWPTLEKRLDELFDAGYRRIVVQRPGGSLAGETKVNQSQYHHLTDAQKHVIQYQLADWIACRRAGCDGRPAAPDMEMGVFIGSFQWRVCSPCLTPDGGADGQGNTWWDCPPSAEMRFMDPNDPESLADIYENVAPWAEAGFNSIWFDNASRHDPKLNQTPDALLALRDMSIFDSLKLGGEAVPWFKVDGERYIDTYYTEQAPWFAVYWWFRRTGWLGFKGSNPHTVDPTKTEIGVVFTDSPHKGGSSGVSNGVVPYGIQQAAEARDCGYVVWAACEEATGFVQRLYDGDDDGLYAALVLDGVPADFNADGAVDCLDYSLFVRQWAQSAGGWLPDPTFWDGDIDNDDKVTLKDFSAFAALTDWSACSGN